MPTTETINAAIVELKKGTTPIETIDYIEAVCLAKIGEWGFENDYVD